MDHATVKIFLYNVGALCNMKSVICDMMSALCDMRSTLCDMGAL